jgi:hypothetical protein
MKKTASKTTPPSAKKVRTIQTVRFGKSKIDLGLAQKTLRQLMRDREVKKQVPVAKKKQANVA